MTNDFCFLSVAFGPRYIEQQTRLHKSLQAIHPEARHLAWTDKYPEYAKPHSQSLYGFKVHAVNQALRHGYKKIIWLDTAIILQKPIDPWLDLVKDYGVLAARDDNKLNKCFATSKLMWYSLVSIPDWMHLVGGSVYVFDFDLPKCQDIFRSWEGAERGMAFGSQAEQSSGKINGHRHDESCMAMALYKNNSEPVPCDVMRYNQGLHSIVIKQHFK